MEKPEVLVVWPNRPEQMKQLDETYLLDMENVVFQPHCSSGTVETRGAMAQLVVDNLAAHFAGRALLTPVIRVTEEAASA